jgi:hypothetical protein
MSPKRPAAVRPALDRSRSLLTPDPADGQHDHERDAALWLYAWSHDALRPTGELLAARLTTRAVIRPGRSSARRRWDATCLGLPEP